MTSPVFDLRIPLGWLFIVVGTLLGLAGFTLPSEAYGRSLGININVIWGAVMIAFGLLALLLAKREARRRARAAQNAANAVK